MATLAHNLFFWEASTCNTSTPSRWCHRKPDTSAMAVPSRMHERRCVGWWEKVQREVPRPTNTWLQFRHWAKQSKLKVARASRYSSGLIGIASKTVISSRTEASIASIWQRAACIWQDAVVWNYDCKLEGARWCEIDLRSPDLLSPAETCTVNIATGQG